MEPYHYDQRVKEKMTHRIVRDKMTQEELTLLKRLSSGELDGVVGDEFVTSGGSSIWKRIVGGVPMQTRQGPGGRSFNGRESERFDGVFRVTHRWESDEEKLEFLQKYGWLMKDKEAQNYSSRYRLEGN